MPPLRCPAAQRPRPGRPPVKAANTLAATFTDAAGRTKVLGVFGGAGAVALAAASGSRVASIRESPKTCLSADEVDQLSELLGKLPGVADSGLSTNKTNETNKDQQ